MGQTLTQQELDERALAELSNINRVQISINGDNSGTYREKYSLTTYFERNLDIVTTLE